MEWTESCKIEGDQNRRFLKGCVEPIAAHNRLRRLFLISDLPRVSLQSLHVRVLGLTIRQSCAYGSWGLMIPPAH